MLKGLGLNLRNYSLTEIVNSGFVGKNTVYRGNLHLYEKNGVQILFKKENAHFTPYGYYEGSKEIVF
jgi:hypothetical protein